MGSWWEIDPFFWWLLVFMAMFTSSGHDSFEAPFPSLLLLACCRPNMSHRVPETCMYLYFWEWFRPGHYFWILIAGLVTMSAWFQISKQPQHMFLGIEGLVNLVAIYISALFSYVYTYIILSHHITWYPLICPWWLLFIQPILLSVEHSPSFCSLRAMLSARKPPCTYPLTHWRAQIAGLKMSMVLQAQLQRVGGVYPPVVIHCEHGKLCSSYQPSFSHEMASHW